MIEEMGSTPVRRKGQKKLDDGPVTDGGRRRQKVGVSIVYTRLSFEVKSRRYPGVGWEPRTD